MTFAFSQTSHDRAAHLRKGDAWRGTDPLVMVVGGEHVATDASGGLLWLPLDAAPPGEWLYLGMQDGRSYAASMVERVPDDLRPRSLREAGMELTTAAASLAVHAVGIARWHQTHPICSRCGTPTDVVLAGHERVCPRCGAHHFPRTDPAVIMLITDGEDRALLGRQPVWPEGRFSTLAGFVEPGEALEDAVRREVMEEVGVQVGDVRYAGSQPWPFPQSLMLGFFGTALSTEITVDQDEIAQARWFSRQEITDLTASGELLLPPLLSISRWLVEGWHGGEITGVWS